MGGLEAERIIGDSGNYPLYNTDKMTVVDGFADKFVCGIVFDLNIFIQKMVILPILNAKRLMFI